MRVLLCGGGTAGHVNPAIAIGELIERNEPESKIAYVVTRNGIENELVKYKKYTIDIHGIKKGKIFTNFKRLVQLSKAINECKRIIYQFRPDIIIGTGGYATFPVVYAGQKMGIKTVLHESNYYPGKAIKALYKKADLVLVNFEDTIKFLKKKSVVCVGNPLRKEFEKCDKQTTKDKLKIKEKYVILACGGSLGAERINESIIDLIDNYIKYNSDLRLIWSTGKREYDLCKEKLTKKRLDKIENVNIYPYIYNMSETMMCADVVISRAGATSISEISACKKCAILIPSPNVANNHQYKNAELLERHGAAKLIKEDNIYRLIETVKGLILNDEERAEIEKKVGEFHKENTNKRIYYEIKNLKK
ncbi:MAG: undecaprenyldiphospho-muramoylpentapeptide beta-N-acetylglucosaminyltransferase [Clostridia bacterium]|nr:undecaprenyldiphospho-muramoylpentapeptide beta-N-acetylglucosaminyltransferase [Clostridia bacterium]